MRVLLLVTALVLSGRSSMIMGYTLNPEFL